MHVFTSDESLGHAGDEVVFHESRLGRAIVWAAIAIPGVLWCLSPMVTPLGWVFAALVGAPCVAVSLLFLPGLLRGLRRPWWIVRVRRDGVILRLRSYLNNSNKRTDPPPVVSLPRSEVERVSRVKVRRIVPGTKAGSQLVVTTHALDFTLKHAETAALRDAIERERSDELKKFGRFHAHPARLTNPGVVRVIFSSPTFRLSPGVRRALEALRDAGYSVDERCDERTVDWRKLSPDEIDDLARECATETNEMDAIRLLRASRGYDLARAKRVIEERRPPQPTG